MYICAYPEVLQAGFKMMPWHWLLTALHEKFSGRFGWKVERQKIRQQLTSKALRRWEYKYDEVWCMMIVDDCCCLDLAEAACTWIPKNSILRILPKHWSAFWRLSNLIISSNVPGHCRLHSEIHKCLSFVLQGSFAKPRQQRQIKVPALDTNLLAPTALFQKLGMNRTGLNRTRLGSPSSVQRLQETPWIFILKKLGCHNARTSWKLENGVLTSKT